MDDPKLLPCPFCGADDIDPEEWMDSHGRSGPGCAQCGAQAEDATRWNWRAAPPPAADASWSGAAQWLRDHYQDHATIAALCDAMVAASPAPPHPDYPCRSDGRCQYAIDHGAEGLGHCPRGKCAMAPAVDAVSETQREAMIDAMCHAETYTPHKADGTTYSQREYMALLLAAALAARSGR